MKTIQVAAPGGLDKLKVVEMDVPKPGPGEILVKAGASSLNFHDYIVATGGFPTEDGRIPMSDVAGEVTEIGAGVTRFKVGDKVMGTFFPKWLSGAPSVDICWGCIPGDTAQGYAAEYVCNSEQAFTVIPDGYSLEEAATLPCAGVTAWRALFVDGNLEPGETVLVQGTGGVSIFALQMAKAAGAKVIATSSSDAKLEKLKAMGADHLINYKTTENWGEAVAALCPLGGVDHVVEVGGNNTLAQSVKACREGGHIAVIGVLTGLEGGGIGVRDMMLKQLRVQGLTVGSREHQENMVRGLNVMGIKPVIDRSFALTEIADAFRHQESQKHFGKIVLKY